MYKSEFQQLIYQEMYRRAIEKEREREREREREEIRHNNVY